MATVDIAQNSQLFLQKALCFPIFLLVVQLHHLNPYCFCFSFRLLIFCGAGVSAYKQTYINVTHISGTKWTVNMRHLGAILTGDFISGETAFAIALL
jgi:hypothetical protein